MSKKVVICCDIDDTLWDLLFYWIKYNNYLHNCGDYRYQLLDENLNAYTSWTLTHKFNNEKSKQLFFNLLSKAEFWSTVQTTSDRVKTLKKLNNDNRIKLYIVTAMKVNNYVKLQRFKQLFPFIDDDQIIRVFYSWILYDIVKIYREKYLEEEGLWGIDYGDGDEGCLYVDYDWLDYFKGGK